MNDLLNLVDDSTDEKVHDFYKILIVDDEDSVHAITNMALKNKQFDGKKLEILEHKSIAHDHLIQALINKLHDIGLKISIDDFGSHCSNFSQLSHIHIVYIKIDGSFIKDIVMNKDSQIISRTIIDYAHQKNIPVIAEFVHSDEIYNYVKSINADYAQGYYISPPRPDIS